MYIKKNIKPGPKRGDPLKRLMSNVTKAETCWLFEGKKDRKGYGVFYFHKQDGTPYNTGSHRASWILHNGQIPEGLLVCHKCDVPNCINPEHLFLGTYKDNVDDMDRKGRRVTKGCHGEQNGSAKLSKMQVELLRLDYEYGKYSQEELGKLYGIKQTQVSRIIRNQSWKKADNEIHV